MTGIPKSTNRNTTAGATRAKAVSLRRRRERWRLSLSGRPSAVSNSPAAVEGISIALTAIVSSPESQGCLLSLPRRAVQVKTGPGG